MNTDRIVEEIKKGNLVLTPTDTVYGILADSTNPVAIAKVFDCKERAKSKPLILIVDSIDMLRLYTQNISQLEDDIIEKYFPSKLTLLLQKNARVHDMITGGGTNLVGIRIPDHAELREIIHQVGRPLISTSANLSGRATVINIKEIPPKLLDKIAYIEDAGPIKAEPSSLIKVEDGKIKVLRDGKMAQKLLLDYRQSK